MTHYQLHIALICLFITIAIQCAAPRIPATLLQAARIVQVMLGVLTIWFAAEILISHMRI